ncbi:MAG: NADH-quinone oxidoreductase subunit M, partial [Acidimicrobiia bacterium]
EFPAILSAWDANVANVGLFRGYMVVAAIGTVLAAGYFLWMLQKVNFGEPGEEWASHDLHDVDRWEMAAWVPLVVTIIAIGVFPRIVFGATNDAVAAMVQSVFGG